MENNFIKYDDSSSNTLSTPYDYYSVMHYSAYAFSNNNLPTITPVQSGVTIGQRQNLSGTDAQAVRILYNCSSVGVPLTTVNFTTPGKFLLVNQ